MGDEPLETGNGPDPGSDAETEYPKAPGASKMEAIRRIERSLEHQGEHTTDREGPDARKLDESPAAKDETDGSTGDLDA